MWRNVIAQPRITILDTGFTAGRTLVGRRLRQFGPEDFFDRRPIAVR